jgi:hypothetical protein
MSALSLSGGDCLRWTRFVRFAPCGAAQVCAQLSKKRVCRKAQTHVTMPTMPGAGFTMIKAKLILGTFEALFDSPA